MSKGIISLWFKAAKSKAQNAPKELWIKEPPPDKSNGLPLPVSEAFVFYDTYGLTINPFLPIRGAPPLIAPFPPVTHMWTGNESPTLPHDQFNFLMTFGNPGLEYKYRPWECKKISDYDGVLEVHAPFNYADWPPPYRAYWKLHPSGPNAGQPVGQDGKLSVYNIQLADETDPITTMIPQSFIGVTSAGELRILLQTDTRADYNGYMYTMDKAQALFAQSTIFIAPITAPPTPGYWDYIGPYWAGWQFTYKDTSKELMTAWPEFFMINGPLVDEGWNHLLFSFDISGSVSLTVSEAMTPHCSTRCKAWVAVNDTNWTDNTLQWHPSPLPYFPGTPFTPAAVWTRAELGLGPNDIVPQSVFLHGYSGNPKNDLARAWASDLGGYSGYANELNPYAYISFLGLGGGPGIVDPVTAPDTKMFPTPSYSCGSFSIPTLGQPIGLPASSVHANHIKGVYTAELQIWEGQTLDTSVEANRRLFIDAEGKPENMKVAEEALGKPDIILHTTRNWKEGKNTGTLGIDGDSHLIPGGQFEPVGNIVKYLPDPELGK